MIAEVKMTTPAEVQYVMDEEGQVVSVIVPIGLWREIASERETADLLKSETMKTRLLAANKRTAGVSLEETRAQLGI
jgi:hypothetical protein